MAATRAAFPDSSAGPTSGRTPRGGGTAGEPADSTGLAGPPSRPAGGATAGQPAAPAPRYPTNRAHIIRSPGRADEIGYTRHTSPTTDTFMRADEVDPRNNGARGRRVHTTTRRRGAAH